MEELEILGLSEMEWLVIETSFHYADTKDWKKCTVAECAKCGISQTEVTDAIKKVRKQRKGALQND